jgi:hypothetical protein
MVGLRGSQAGRRKSRRRFQFEGLEPRQVLAANLVISEFMASNTSTVSDEDGQESDWIEIYNADTVAVNLTDWYLSDNAGRLDKWAFPSQVIQPGDYLMVWASGKDRATAGQPLHTNFALSADGEYLALVYDDPIGGFQRVVEFNPFPEQQGNVSYGYDQPVTTTSLIGTTAPASSLVPTPANGGNSLGTSWTTPGFNDSSWTSGSGGIGYDEGGELNSLVDSNVEGAMQGINSSIFTRYEFGGVNAGMVDELNFAVNYDDGFVAYLNGTEVARRNAPLGTPAWDAAATDEHGGIQATVSYANFANTSAFSCLSAASVAGGACNVSANRLRLTNAAGNLAGAAWTSQGVQFGPDFTFSTRMDIDIHSPGGGSDGDGTGADGMLFVLQADGSNRIGGAGGAMGIDGGVNNFVAVEFDTWATGSFDPAAGNPPSHIGIDVGGLGSIAHIAVPRFNGGALGANVRHVWIDYDGATDQMRVYFTDQATKPATPTLTATVDFETIFGDTPFLYAGWTAGTGGALNAHDVLNWDITTDAKDSPGLEQEIIDLSQHIGLLSPTSNVLAIHGLNLAPTDSDFVTKPNLSANEISAIDLDPVRWFTAPTPGRPNNVGGDEPSDPVVFSHESGTFINPFGLTLTADPGATIYYTTNGSKPTTASTVYTGPISISNTTQVRAISVVPGQAASTVVSAHFLGLDNTVAGFESNLPIFIIETYNVGIPGTTSPTMINGTGVVISPDASGRARMSGGTFDYASRMGVRVRGRTSSGFAKQPYSIEFRNEDDSDKDVELVGMPADSDWALLSPHSEKALMQNPLTYKWADDAGGYAPRTRFVEVFRNADGDGKLNYAEDYLGIYVLSERIKISNDRVDIDELDPGDATGLEVTGGYIFKKDKFEEGGDVWFNVNGGVNGPGRAGPALIPGQTLQMHDPDSTDATTAQINYLQNHLNQFVAALDGPDFMDPVNGYAKFIDVDSWINHWINVELTKNIDGFRLSNYYYKERDTIDPVTQEVVLGKIFHGPIWDSNLSLSNANYLRGGHPTGWYKDQLSNTDYPYWNRLFQDPNFRQKLTDRWQELRRTIFSTENLLADIENYTDELSDGNPLLDRPLPTQSSNPLSRNDAEYPGHISTYHWPNCYYPGNLGDCPTSAPGVGAYPTPTTYQAHLTILRDFVTQRVAWMDTQFLGSPLFSQNGGIVEPGYQLTMTSPVSQSFTETTLVDVGAPATAIVPDAALNTAIGTTWRNRVFDDSTWIHGTTGVGYERGTGYEGDLGINLLTVNPPSMRIDPEGDGTNNNNTTYVRIPFNFSGNPADIDALFLRVRYDDSYVAYLNGTEIGRANFTGTPAWNSPATAPPTHEAGSFEEINVTAFKNQLLTGNNVLAIHAMNDQSASTDMLLLPVLVARDDGVASTAPIYYTTDGSDPLTPGGGINPTAQLYTGPITINENTQIIARTYKAGTPIATMATNWSGDTDYTFVTSATPIVVSEINYNPAPPTQAETNVGVTDANEFEFIELKNVGSEVIDLTGYRFTAGIDFTFPSGTLAPGEHVLIVRNEPAFHLRHGTGQNIAGEYDGSLANEGEHISLMTGINELVMDFDYSDAWYGLTDGEGFSLTIVDPQAEHSTWSDQSSWRPSDYSLGSPDGDDNALAPPQDSLKINEIITNSATGDRIEIRNTSAAAINIDGFKLTYSTPDLVPVSTTYTLPASTPVVPAGGYLVLDAATYFGGTFDISLDGGSLRLSAADGSGALLGFRTDEDFGAADPETTHGRYTKSDGSTDFVQLTANTLGGANAGPVIGSVAINELMYHPAFGDDEFIELYNRTGAPVNLNGWSLKSGSLLSYYTFGNVTLGGGSYLVVSSTDPAAFRAKYAVPASVQVVGPFTGVLEDNDPNGESVELHRPPTGPGTASVRVDQVRYFPTAPWPTSPSGFGPSLARIDASAYGNDVINWTAGVPGGSPGGPNVPYDTTPPSQPGAPTLTVNADQSVTLNWAASSDAETGVARYHIVRNGSEIGSSTTTSFTDTTASLSTAYSYVIVAENAHRVSSNLSGSTPIRIFGMTGLTRVDATHFRVTFPEGVTEASAENVANYTIPQVGVVSAVREANGTNVVLTTSAPIVEGTGYRVVANNLVGVAAGSVLLPNTNRTIIPGVANALLGEYYDDTAGSFATPPASAVLGTKVAERVDPVIQFTWLGSPNPYTGGGPPFTPNPTLPSSAANTIGVRWSGRLIAPTTGQYTFTFTISANDGVRFWIDADDDGQFEDIPSERIVNAWPSTTAQTATINLVANQVYDVRLDFYENTSTAQLWMSWQHPGQATAVIVPSSNFLTPTATETERPNVTAIKLGSSSWTPAFKSQLQAAGFGTGGINVPLGGTTQRLPWSNLNQVSMTFDEDMAVVPGSLLVNGVNATNYGVESVTYDYATFTATWTLANPLPNDRVTLSLASSAADLVGNSVEGTTNATVLALPGDVNQSGVVDQADFRASFDAQFRGIGSPGYSVLLDTDGNGAVNIQDWQNVHVAIGDTVPAPSPASAPSAVVVSGGTSRASDRSAGAATLRTSSAPRLSRAAIDQVITTPSDSSARTLRASRAPRTSATVNPAALDELFTTN